MEIVKNERSLILAKRLKYLRQINNLTQDQLAQNIGLTASAIAHWEVGKREISYSKLEKFAEYFNVSISYLLGERELKNENETIDYFLKELEQTNFVHNGELNDNMVKQLIEMIKFIDNVKK